MGTLTRKRTTQPPRSSHIPLPCRAAKHRRRLLTLQQNQPSPFSSLLNLPVNHQASHPNSHLLSKAADKQVEGSLRTGGIPHGEAGADKVKVGETAIGRIGLKPLGQTLSPPEQVLSRPGEDQGMEAVGAVVEEDAVEGDAEEGDAEVGGVEGEDAAEEGVVVEARALDRVAAADEALAGAGTGARPWQAGGLLPVTKPGRNSIRWER